LLEMTIVLKSNTGFDELAVPLDVHVLVRVHEDVRDGGIFQQRLQGTKAEDLIENLFCKAITLRHADRKMILAKDSLERRLHLATQFLPALRFHRVHVQDVEQLLMHAHLEIRSPVLVLRGGRCCAWRCSSNWNGLLTHINKTLAPW